MSINELITEKGKHTNDTITVFPRSFESIFKQPLELLESRTFNTAKNSDIFDGQLERCSLESNVPRRVG